MTDNEALIPRIKAILAETRATSAESFQLQRLVVDYTERTVTSNDRERIAELERDLAHARSDLAAARAHNVSIYEALNDTNINLAQNAAITETLRAELEQMKAAQRDVVLEDAAATPVGEEEQGPWVFYEVDAECLMWGGIGDHEEGEAIDWSSFLDYVTPWSVKGDVEALHTKACEDSGVRKGSPKMRVITLAEARRIAGAK